MQWRRFSASFRGYRPGHAHVRGAASCSVTGPPGQRPTLRLAPRTSPGRGGDARVSRLIPWIFRNEAANVAELRTFGASALLVDVESSDGRELGTAVCNLQKGGPLGNVNILARMLTNNTNAPIDTAFFVTQLRRALEHRERCFGSSRPCYRLINAEGDLLPGVLCDRFDDVLCLQFTSAAMEYLFEEQILDALDSFLSPRAVIIRCDDVRVDRNLELAPISSPRVARGSYDGPTTISHEMVARNVGSDNTDGKDVAFTFEADLLSEGWTSGRYFEERRLRELLFNSLQSGSVITSRQKRIISFFGESLGIFCASVLGEDAGQVVYALGSPTGGEGIPEVDQKIRHQLELLARRNQCFDRIDFACLGTPGPHALEKEHQDNYDIVLLEPPALAPTYGRLEDGLRLYSAWIAAAATATRSGGRLILVCRSRAVSSQKLLRCVNLGVWSAGRRARLVDRWSGGPPDFPVHMGLLDSQKYQVMVLSVQ